MMNDLLSASSILLAILTALYGFFYPSINEVLLIKPSTHPVDDKRNYAKAKETRNTRLIPLMIGTIVISLVFLPEFLNQMVICYDLLIEHGFQKLSYDTLIATFMVVCFFIFLLTINTVNIFFKYVSKMKKINPDRS
ncbi:hypothetical protein [Gaoshiqia sediminis]|uniref:Uncharacterized protein n=1 Tax=Gaoshiqia sediminis TaxID=2986998 RepID=A0AA41Y6K0_9BACT|nr:hypothetical protein [Gaoshiqia sediminis]MCW0482411.1 hypothetical protein [Gaoshiqia sediminis]